MNAIYRVDDLRLWLVRWNLSERWGLALNKRSINQWCHICCSSAGQMIGPPLLLYTGGLSACRHWQWISPSLLTAVNLQGCQSCHPACESWPFCRSHRKPWRAAGGRQLQSPPLRSSPSPLPAHYRLRWLTALLFSPTQICQKTNCCLSTSHTFFFFLSEYILWIDLCDTKQEEMSRLKTLLGKQEPCWLTWNCKSQHALLQKRSWAIDGHTWKNAQQWSITEVNNLYHLFIYMKILDPSPNFFIKINNTTISPIYIKEKSHIWALTT